MLSQKKKPAARGHDEPNPVVQLGGFEPRRHSPATATEQARLAELQSRARQAIGLVEPDALGRQQLCLSAFYRDMQRDLLSEVGNAH